MSSAARLRALKVLEKVRLLILLLLGVPGGIGWAPALVVLHLFIISEFAVCRAKPQRRTASSVSRHRLHAPPFVSESSPPCWGDRRPRHKVQLAPRWLRLVVLCAASCQLVTTLVATLVMRFTNAFRSLTHGRNADTTRSLALLHTFGVYAPAQASGEWARFTSTMTLSLLLAVSTEPLHRLLFHVLGPRGWRLTACATRQQGSTPMSSPTIPIMVTLALSAVVPALVPSVDNLLLLLWHIFVTGGHAFATRTRAGPSAGASRLAVLSLAVISTLLLIAQLVCQVPLVVYALDLRLGAHTASGSDSLRGTHSGWSTLWRSDAWLSALRREPLAWRKLCQMISLLGVAFLARLQLAQCTHDLTKCLRRAFCRLCGCSPGTARLSEEEESVAMQPATIGHFESDEDHECGSVESLSQSARGGRLTHALRHVRRGLMATHKAVKAHFHVVVVIPVLLTASLLAQDAASVVLLAVALIGLVLRADWWVTWCVPIASVAAVLLVVLEYVVVACSGGDLAQRTAFTNLQRGLFLHRHGEPVKPSATRVVWMVLLEVTAIDALLCLWWGDSCTAAQEDGEVRETGSAAGYPVAPSTARKVHRLRSAYVSLTTGATNADEVLTRLANDFIELLDEQARQFGQCSRPVVHAPSLLPRVLLSANTHAVTHLDGLIKDETVTLDSLCRGATNSSEAANGLATTTREALWRVCACGDPLPLASLVTTMGVVDSRLRLATWAQLASPMERHHTPEASEIDEQRNPAEEVAVFVADAADDEGDVAVEVSPSWPSWSTRRRGSVRRDDSLHVLNRLLAVGSPGQESLGLLDYFWLVDALRSYHTGNVRARRSLWRAWWGLGSHLAATFAAPVLLLVLFAAAMTVEELDVLNATYVLFFLCFVGQRTWQDRVSPGRYAVWSRTLQRLFAWYVVGHVLAVFVGSLVQASFGPTSAADGVLRFVGITADRPMAQLLVYVLLLFLVHLARTRCGHETPCTTRGGEDSLSACLQQHEWRVFESQRYWEPVRGGLRLWAIGLTLVLVTVLLHHSVLVLGLGVLFCAYLLALSNAWSVRHAVLVLLTVYCPAVLLWLTLAQLPRVRSAVSDALTASGCDPRELGVYARDALGRGRTVPTLLLPWYLLSALTTSLLAMTWRRKRQLRPEEGGAPADRTASSTLETFPASSPAFVAPPTVGFVGQGTSFTASRHGGTPFATAGVRLADRLLASLQRICRSLRCALVALQVGPLLQWTAQLVVAGTNVSCLGVLYGVAYATDWPRPFGVALMAFLHVLLQYLVGLSLILNVDVERSGLSTSSLVVRILDYVGLHTPLESWRTSARYMFLPMLVAVAAACRLVLGKKPEIARGTSFSEPLFGSEEVLDRSSRMAWSTARQPSWRQPAAVVVDMATPMRRPLLSAASPGSDVASHEPAEYIEEEPRPDAEGPPQAQGDSAAETSSHTPQQWSVVQNYVRRRAFGDLIYEATVLIAALAVALLIDNVVGMALLLVLLVLGAVGRSRLLICRGLSRGLEWSTLLILAYAYVIVLGVPRSDGTVPRPTVPILLQPLYHDRCDLWDMYLGCHLRPSAWVLSCLLALLQRLLRRHRRVIARHTLATPISGCRRIDELLARYDAAHRRRDKGMRVGERTAVTHTDTSSGAPLSSAECCHSAGQHHRQDDSTDVVDGEEVQFTNPSPIHVPLPTAPLQVEPVARIPSSADAPPTPTIAATATTQKSIHARQRRLLTALRAFEGCPDRVRDPHNALQWLYATLTQLLPASVLLFLHGVMLANIAGAVMAIVALALLCLRRRLVERWTSVWRWISCTLVILFIPQCLWRLPVFADAFVQISSKPLAHTVSAGQTALIVCGMGPWSTRALVLHMLVLWCAVAVERRLFTEFYFAPYLLGLCHTSASARARRAHVRWLYQTRWKHRETVAHAQEAQLRDTLARLAAARQPGVTPPYTPLRESVHARGDSDEEDDMFAAAEAVLRSVSASPIPLTRRTRTNSIAFVLVETPMTEAAALTPAWCSTWASAVSSPSASTPVRGPTTSSEGTHAACAEVSVSAPKAPSSVWSRFCAFCSRHTQSAAAHLLAHSYQPTLSVRVARHPFVALCVAVYRYGMRHSADVCFVLLLLNYALSGVVTDMLFSLSALLYSMVARPWAGKIYWYGVLAGLVVSVAMKLVCQVVVTRIAVHSLPPTFVTIVRIALLDLGRGREVSPAAMRADILMDFACCFAVLAHCHASHDLGLFGRPYESDKAGSIPHAATKTVHFAEGGQSPQRATVVSPPTPRSHLASTATVAVTESDSEADGDTSMDSSSSSLHPPSPTVVGARTLVGPAVRSAEVPVPPLHERAEDTVPQSATTDLPPRSPLRRRHKVGAASLVGSLGHALRDVWEQRRGRRGAGADHYTIQFWLDGVALIIFCWAFYAIRYASTSWRNNVVRSLERNLLPGLFVVLLFVGVVLLCVERVVYVCHHGPAKYVLHVSLVLFYHIAFIVWRVKGATWVSGDGDAGGKTAAVVPASPSPLAPALNLLLVKLASAWVSAWQLRAGYSLMRRHDPFTARTDLFHWLGHMIARGIPFLLEARLFLDWVSSATALKVQHWWLLEDVHHLVYLRFVDMSDIHWTSPHRGTRFPMFVKLYQGLVGVLVILAAVFFPLFFYSTFSPQTQPTAVRNWHMSLHLQPTSVLSMGAIELYAAGADVPQRTREDVLTREPFAKGKTLPLLDKDFLSDARTIQAVSVPALSAAYWAVTSETVVDLARRVSQSTAGEVVKLQIRLSYLSQTQSEREDASTDATGLTGNEVSVTLEYTLPALSVQQLAAALGNVVDRLAPPPSPSHDPANDACDNSSVHSSASVSLPQLVYSQWINSGTTLQPVTDASGAAVRDCYMRWVVECTACCSSRVSTLFYCDEDEAAPGSALFDTAVASDVTHPRLFMLVRSLDATTSSGLLGYLSGLGIIALYTTLVLTLSNLLRGTIAGGAHQVLLRQMANPQPLATLLRHLYWVRSSASNGHVEEALWLEQQLFLELVDLLRSPARLMEEGGRRIDDYDEQGAYQHHLAQLAERPFSG